MTKWPTIGYNVLQNANALSKTSTAGVAKTAAHAPHAALDFNYVAR